MPEFSLKTLQFTENIEKKLREATQSLAQLRDEQTWPSATHLDQAISQSVDSLEAHLANLHKHAGELLKSGQDVQNTTDEIEGIFRRWHIDKNPPSLLSMCIFLLEEMALKPSPDDLNTLIAAAILGQVHNEPAYHNHMHFRKVLAQIMRLIINNNDIYSDTKRALNTYQICLLLSAACIHDLDHDGQGNWIKGVHVEARAEKHSFELAKPYLTAAGCDDAALNALYVMLLTTDVSPLDDPTNPMMQMKSAYRFHFMGEDTKAHSLNLSQELRILEKDKDLATLCLLLHEADIATSAGLTYDITKYETSLIMEEFKGAKAHPSDVITFLNQICQRRFLSDAGQKLFAANIARIYALAESDVESGNEAYPSSDHADFTLLPTHKNDDQTVN